MSTTLRRLPLLLFAFLAALLIWPAAPARAKTVVIQAEPVDGALLSEAPRSVKLWFNHAAAVAPEDLHLTDANGHEVTVIGLHAEPYKPGDLGLADQFDASFLYLCATGAASWPTVLTVHLPAMAAGTYQLSWRSIGLEDRRDASGTLVFAVDTEAAQTPPVSRSGVVDDLLVALAVQPNRPGDNFFSVRVTDRRRPERAPVERVRLVLTPPGAQGPATELEAVAAGPGRYQIASGAMAVPGDWRVAVVVSRSGMPDTTFDAAWDLPAGRRSFPGLSILGLVSAAGLVVFGVTLYRRRSS